MLLTVKTVIFSLQRLCWALNCSCQAIQFVDTAESLSPFFLEQLLTTADAPQFLPTPLLYTPTI